MEPSAIVVTLTISDSHGSTTSSRTNVLGMCCLYLYDLWGASFIKEGLMEQYRYHYDDMDKDSRDPACYMLTYRGCTYWSCYRIHLRDWLEQKYFCLPAFNKKGS